MSLDRSYVSVDGEWVQWDEDVMKFLNIEEDFGGRDLITFEYNNKTYQSYITTR